MWETGAELGFHFNGHTTSGGLGQYPWRIFLDYVSSYILIDDSTF